jgi:uncharacterized zinc-type alcohol dehydrogenase-like protein
VHSIRAFGAAAAGQPLSSMSIQRREPGPHDVVIAVEFCGVCHSDLHQVRDEWSDGAFPMIPGHEIVGRVARRGAEVAKLDVGERVGVGCLVGSCRRCGPCAEHLEQFCEVGPAWTYNSTEMDRKTPTYGGYSTEIVVDERFALRVPASLDPAGAAPLLCAGITTYSPLCEWGTQPGDRVGVIGLGGLGHMAVKLAASMGARVTVFSSSPGKEDDARRLGAAEFLATRGQRLGRLAHRLDLLIDTISAPHDYDAYLKLLRPRGAMVLVGIPSTSAPVRPLSLIGGNRRLAGSLIGGIAETQRMLDHCGAHGIVADIELIPIQKINEAYERMLRSDVRYRFVIDLATLSGAEG